MADLIQLRRDTAANWTSANPVLAQGEPGVETDTDNMKIGDGVTPWNTLAYVIGATTDLSYNPTTRLLSSSTGNDVSLPLVGTSTAGLRPATSFTSLTYASTVDLDMLALNGQYRTITLTGNLTFTTSNRAEGLSVVLRLLPGASQRTLTFPVDWPFLGTKPANIAANKVGILSLTCFGSTDADCVAAYAVQS